MNGIDPSGLDNFDDVVGGFSSLGSYAAVAGDVTANPEVGLPAGGFSVAATALKTAYNCTGNGDQGCAQDVGNLAVGATTLGTGATAAKFGAAAATGVSDATAFGLDQAQTLYNYFTK